MRRFGGGGRACHDGGSSPGEDKPAPRPARFGAAREPRLDEADRLPYNARPLEGAGLFARRTDSRKEPSMGLIEKVEAAHLKGGRPDMSPGDTVEVLVRVIEGDKERQQLFRGEVINVRGAGMRKTFTVRKVSEGVGVERTFPLHGPSVAEIKVIKHAKSSPREALLPPPQDRQGGTPHERTGGERDVVTPRPAWRRLARMEARLAGEAVAAGVDEAGRGPLAGPVVAAAVILGSGRRWDGVDDSKKVPPEVRAEVFARVREGARAFSWSVLGPRAIDRYEHPRRQPRGHAARGAAAAGVPPSSCWWTAGIGCPASSCRQEAIIDGDAKVLAIAAASILAKVVRDRIMERLDRVWPHYGFARHKGYATPEHLEARSSGSGLARSTATRSRRFACWSCLSTL